MVGIEKEISGKGIAGALSGLTKKRKLLGKENVILSSWNPEERELIYKIKDCYKQIVIDWVKDENIMTP